MLDRIDVANREAYENDVVRQKATRSPPSFADALAPDMSPSEGAVGRDDLAAAAHRLGRISRREARGIVDQMLAEIIDGLTTDGVVLLSGFGRFEAIRKGERVGRNPRTGEEYPVTARVSVQFNASVGLKKKVMDAPLRTRRDRASAPRSG